MKFTAFERSLQGTGASRRLRLAGKVPGIVYGAGEPQTIELDHNALFFALKKEAFHSSVLEMELGGKTEQVLLRDFQMHAYKQIVQHIDFQRVDAQTRLRKKVPLHFEGEENSPAVKNDASIVNHVATEVEVECLATQLPEFITVDLSGLVKGNSLRVSDLKFPAGIKAVRHGTQNPVVVSVADPKVNAEDAAAEAAAAEAAAAAAAATGGSKGKGGKAAPAKAAPAKTAAAGPAAGAKKK